MHRASYCPDITYSAGPDQSNWTFPSMIGPYNSRTCFAHCGLVVSIDIKYAIKRPLDPWNSSQGSEKICHQPSFDGAMVQRRDDMQYPFQFSLPIRDIDLFSPCHFNTYPDRRPDRLLLLIKLRRSGVIFFQRRRRRSSIRSRIRKPFG